MGQDFSNYRPTQAVLDGLKEVSFIGVVGPTAVGKSTVVKRAKELDDSLHIVLTTTSRRPRPGERDGVDYHFRSREEVLARIERKEFVQVPPSLLGDLYASAPEDYSVHGTSVLAVIAEAVPTMRQLPFHDNRTVFILPPDYATWQQRIVRHNFTPEQLQKRLAEAGTSLQFACDDSEVVFVLNDDIDVAAESFVALMHGETPNVEQQAACRELAGRLLTELQQSTGLQVA